MSILTGKEALIALANGEEVEFENPFQNFWVDIKSLTIIEIEGGYYVCPDDDTKVKTQFRLKPRTITINGIEVPAPFEPKEGDEYFYIRDAFSGYGQSYLSEDEKPIFGAWRTEEEIKQVVAALRQVFGGAQ